MQIQVFTLRVPIVEIIVNPHQRALEKTCYLCILQRSIDIMGEIMKHGVFLRRIVLGSFFSLIIMNF